MVILPLLYLFWWKKRWRILIGVIILAVLVVSYFAPSEIAYSILKTETEKERPLQQLQKALGNISNDEPNSSDNEKLKLEKEIARLQKGMEKDREKIIKEEGNKEENRYNFNFKRILKLRLEIEWVKKWGKKENISPLLFCGEEFNQELQREKRSGHHSWKSVESYNIIDFERTENNKISSFRKKLQEICEQKENNFEKSVGNSPIIWLKNIDKITSSKLKKELLKVVDSEQNNNLGKYQTERKEGGKTVPVEEIINLSPFTLVATTSTSNPKLSKKLKAKLKQVEPFPDKYFWVIFFISAGAEIIIFVLLIRSRRKSKDKSLKKLEY